MSGGIGAGRWTILYDSIMSRVTPCRVRLPVIIGVYQPGKLPPQLDVRHCLEAELHASLRHVVRDPSEDVPARWMCTANGMHARPAGHGHAICPIINYQRFMIELLE